VSEVRTNFRRGQGDLESYVRVLKRCLEDDVTSREEAIISEYLARYSIP
jgi:hypothetical protein